MKFLKGLGVFICSVVLFISTFVLLLLLPISNGIKKESVKKMISELQIEELAEESPSFKESLDEMLDPVYKRTRELGIDDQIVLKIMDSKEVKELTADVTSNLLDYLLTGKNQELLSEENIKELVETAIDSINKNTDFKINKEDKNEILELVDDNSDIYMELIPKTDIIKNNLTEENEQALSLFRFFFSSKLKIYFLIAFGISLIGLILLKLKNIKWLKYSAVTIICASILSLIIALFMWVLALALFQLDYPYIYSVVSIVIKNSLIVSGSITGIMIILLIVYKILSKNNKEKELTTDAS